MQKNLFQKFSFTYEIRFAVEKNQKKFWAKFSKFSKKCQSYNFHMRTV